MAQYATAEELASYLHQDLDTASAELALTIASEMFSKRARTWFAPSAATYTTTGTSAGSIELPLRPVISVTAVRVNGVPLAVDYSLVRNKVYRLDGFGDPWASPPDLVEIDYTHGLTSVPGDVKGAVLETAALLYMNPTGASQESVDDYSVRYAASGGGGLSPLAEKLANYYRGILVA